MECYKIAIKFCGSLADDKKFIFKGAIQFLECLKVRILQ